MENTKLLEKYAKRLGSKGTNRNFYLKVAGDFLEYAGGNFERETVDGFLAKLKKKKHYSEGSVNLIFRVIRTLYNRNNLEWPFAQGDAPQIREDSVQVPALHPNTIMRLIEKARASGEPDERAFLALSTTYALRRIEMVELGEKDIRIKDQTIHIATAKHGRERTHMIPDAILPYLEGYDFDDQKLSQFSLTLLWYRLERSIGLDHINRVGWHSIRRTVNTLLARKLSENTVKAFLRHKQATSSNMTYRYSAVRFVGEPEDMVEVVGGALQADLEVFAEGVHPFIDYWV